MNLTIGALICGFRVIRDGDVPLLNAHYWQLRHETTGATLYYTDRDDGQMVFSVGFRTLPENDTGVFHILEHSCLDGSESYRLKEPFVNLLHLVRSRKLGNITAATEQRGHEAVFVRLLDGACKVGIDPGVSREVLIDIRLCLGS